MNDNLRYRIARILYEDGQRPLVTASRLADAIIENLKLTAEHDYGTTYPKTPVTDVRYTRYVTDWMPDA